MNQRTFDEIRRARSTDPETSKAAARQSHGLAKRHRKLIIDTMSDGGDWNASEIADRSGLTAVQVCRRFAELRDNGLIVETANQRPTKTGRLSQCYVVVEKE